MTKSLNGGCQCGNIRYRASNAPDFVYACHCRECQKQSSSAFGLTKPIEKCDLQVTGSLATYERRAHSGGITSCYFCPQCGTRIYHEDAVNAGVISLKAGTIDEAGEEQIVAHLWSSRKRPWVQLAEDVEQFETQPSDLAHWRRSLFERYS